MKAQPRRPSREVRVGTVAIGGAHPVIIQSMTIADTLDTETVVREIGQLAGAGCPLVRVTVPHVKAAENLPAIRAEMRRRGIRVPLVADIHFTPAAALIAADHCEKVRINPGNYADRKRFSIREYTDAEYREEIDRIHDRFRPLVERLKQNAVALRIGTNHGSLSDRIMNRYGDTPEGMVESALEFVRICEAYGFRDIVLSMKSSIPSVMVAANRLLVRRMQEEGMDYPIHIGVTEAGAGIEGRVKSAIGIGSLLLDGIGDTIRVSLTEDSVHELAACREILAAVGRLRPGMEAGASRATVDPSAWAPVDPPPPSRRATRTATIGRLPYGGKAPPRVEARVTGSDPRSVREALSASDSLAPLQVAEAIVLCQEGEDLAGFLRLLRDARTEAPSAALIARLSHDPGERVAELLELADAYELPRGDGIFARFAARGSSGGHGGPAPVALGLPAATGEAQARATVATIDASLATAGTPILLELPDEPIDAAVAAGRLLIDGIGDGLVAAPRSPALTLAGPNGEVHVPAISLAYGILQGCRLRLTRAEFIACPSCGRTQFDLQTTTKRIQERTAHLRGVKIAIMGCIVNGPGEMADADFGYVGSAPGKIDLYVGKNRVKQAIPAEEADVRLIELIREQGMWTDPPAERA